MKADFLTQELIESYGDRKHRGRLSVVVDTRNSDVHVIPKDREHITYCLDLVNGDARKLEKVIPSHINYDVVEPLSEVVSVITGESGMEQGYGVRHSPNDLSKAHQTVLSFVHKGEVFVHPNLESRIIYDYSTQ